MRIVCPSCSATYEVPEHLLKPGKMARCARCGGEWPPAREPADIEAPPGHVAEPAAEHEPDHAPDDGAPDHGPQLGAEQSREQHRPTAMERLAIQPPASARSRGLLGAWVATVLILAGAVAAMLVWRQEFMSVWPPSGRILAPIHQIPSKPEQILGKTAG
jgi:predicted Zn finger-like uncharacterized protein